MTTHLEAISTKYKYYRTNVLKLYTRKIGLHTTNDLHKGLNVLEVEDIFKHSIVQLVYKQNNNLVPDVFDSYFKLRNQIHNLQNCNAHKLNVIRVKNNGK